MDWQDQLLIGGVILVAAIAIFTLRRTRHIGRKRILISALVSLVLATIAAAGYTFYKARWSAEASRAQASDDFRTAEKARNEQESNRKLAELQQTFSTLNDDLDRFYRGAPQRLDSPSILTSNEDGPAVVAAQARAEESERAVENLREPWDATRYPLFVGVSAVLAILLVFNMAEWSRAGFVAEDGGKQSLAPEADPPISSSTSTPIGRLRFLAGWQAITITAILLSLVIVGIVFLTLVYIRRHNRDSVSISETSERLVPSSGTQVNSNESVARKAVKSRNLSVDLAHQRSEGNASGAQVNNLEADKRLRAYIVGGWVEQGKYCASSDGKIFKPKGKFYYGDEGEYGSWALNGNEIEVRADGTHWRGPVAIVSPVEMRINWGKGKPTRYRRCPGDNSYEPWHRELEAE